ncbi:MAG: hypothetical protein RR998_02455 [Oscillospiraceae bacterium]
MLSKSAQREVSRQPERCGWFGKLLNSAIHTKTMRIEIKETGCMGESEVQTGGIQKWCKAKDGFMI